MTRAVPYMVRDVVNRWRQSGCPRQQGIVWPRRRWIAAFPQHRHYLEALPDLLAREDVRGTSRCAAEGGVATEQAILAVMAWGYGNVGYGPWRTGRILQINAVATSRLAEVAATLASEGAVVAYQLLANSDRLKGLGPAFGTKYLFFCPQLSSDRPALILDRLVASWIRDYSDLDVNEVLWSTRTYQRYLEQMWAWAEVLDVSPDVLEERIFVDEARELGNQWALEANP